MSPLAQALGAIKDLSTSQSPRCAPELLTSDPTNAGTGPTLNPQQLELVGCAHPRIRVTALAGTGKTTALIEYARQRNCKNTLYLAFNRSMAQQAQAGFGPRVKCKTIHSLAWASYGRPIEHKIGRPHDIQALLSELGLPPGDMGLAFTDVLLASLDRFVKSDHPRPCRQDVAALPWATLKEMDHRHTLPDIDQAVSMIHGLWGRAQDPADALVAASHDVAIKKAQMANAKIVSELIMVDEAQDLTPAMASWMQSQQAGILVFAGDPYQEMYSWRQPKPLQWGAPGEHAMVLTLSHRFGPELEPVVNQVLRAMGSAHDINAVGRPTRLGLDQDIAGRHHVLGRTRARLAQYANNALAAGKKVAWPGANTHQSAPADAWSRLSDEYGREDWLLDEFVPDPCGLVAPEDADVILSTVHQAKGQTYERVRVLDDVFDRNNATDRSELCVRYVAFTRATKELSLPSRALELNCPHPSQPAADLSGDGFE